MREGSTKSFLNLLCYTVANGYKAVVICPDKEGIFRYIKDGGVPGAEAVCITYTYDILPFLRKPVDWVMWVPRLVKRFIKNRMAANRLCKILHAKNVQLVHTNTSVNNIGYLAARKLGIPHLWHIREYGKRDFNMIVPFQKKKLTAKNNYVVAITRDILESKHLQESDDMRVIYNGIVEKEEMRYSGVHDGYFLYAGRVSQKKGIEDLIEAYARYVNKAEDNPLILKIAGGISEEMKSRIEGLKNEKRLDNLIEILGPRDDVADLMYKAAAVIIPSYFEGFGRVMPEAMANGALTIGRNTGGTEEQMDNGLNLTGQEIAWRFSNVSELAGLLTQAAGLSKESVKDMILASQKAVQELYTPEKSSRRINDFYSYILIKN